MKQLLPTLLILVACDLPERRESRWEGIPNGVSCAWDKAGRVAACIQPGRAAYTCIQDGSTERGMDTDGTKWYRYVVKCAPSGTPVMPEDDEED